MNQGPRNSEDSKTNAPGKELLDLCKVNDLLIANGRMIGTFWVKSPHISTTDLPLMTTYLYQKLFHAENI